MERQTSRYKGVGPFLDVTLDRRTFFGRPREARSLLGLVEAERLVVLFAKSGIGKTSIINAALLEPLRKLGYFPVVARVNQASGDLFQGVLESVSVAAKQRGVDCTVTTTDEWRFFKDAEFWEADNEPLRPILILDQFEELFTLQPADRRRDFALRLADLTRGRRAGEGGAAPSDTAVAQAEQLPPDLKIVLSLREDFLAHLDELPIPGILRNRLRLGPLGKIAARDAILGPAEIADGDYVTKPFVFEDAAVIAIINFLSQERRGDASFSGDEIEPSQLQLICQYVEEGVRRRQTASSYGSPPIRVTESDLGGESRMRMVLESFYERAVGATTPRSEARRIRLLCERRLVSSNGRRLTEEEDEIRERFGISKNTLQRLVDARLLRAEPRLGGVYHELSHDSLVAPILDARRKRMRSRRNAAVVSALAILTVATTVLATILLQARTAERASAERAALAARLEKDDLPGVIDAVERLEGAHGLTTAELMTLVSDARIVDLVTGLNGQSCEVSAKLLSTMPARLLASRRAFGAALGVLNDLGMRCGGTVGVSEASLLERFIGVHPELARQPTRQVDESLNRRILIEGGTFLMGSPANVGDEDEQPQHRVNLSTFSIQEHEVTNDEYSRFDPSHTFAQDQGPHPVVQVSWYEALAYAAWIGGDLPTEAQWEYTARGTRGREYPWGDDPPGRRAEHYPGLNQSVRVAQHEDSATPDGVHDMAGNISEWCRDWYAPYTRDTATNPLGPATGRTRVVKGNSVYAPAIIMGAAAREPIYPNNPLGNIGFRVVFTSR